MEYKPSSTIDHNALLLGLNMIKAIVNDLLSGDEGLKKEALFFYEGFRLAADGFVEASYLANTDRTKDLVRTELLKYIAEVKAKADEEQQQKKLVN